MRKILSFFVLSMLISCSSDSSEDETIPEPPENAFELSIDLDRSVFGIDEKITINASSSEALGTGCIQSNDFTLDGAMFGRCIHDDLGKGFQVNFSFQTIGTKTFIIEAQTNDARVSKIERQIEIDSTTNSVRITKVTLNSYPSKGRVFDPEFSETDPERLADLFFQIKKRYIDINVGDVDSAYKTVDFLISEVHENESSFEWNFEGNELLFSVDNIFGFNLFDFDGDHSTSEAFTGVIVVLRDYAIEKPNQINVQNFGGSIDVTFDLEWN